MINLQDLSNKARKWQICEFIRFGQIDQDSKRWGTVDYEFQISMVSREKLLFKLSMLAHQLIVISKSRIEPNRIMVKS